MTDLTPPAPANSSAPFHWLTPNLTVFVSSLCIMVVELVAGRLIARYVGSSLYTWTSAIGIVLAGIAVGNYVGGLIADRYRAREALASLFLAASAACMTVPILNDHIGISMMLREQDWAWRIALHVFFVFFAPAAVLGAISPVAATMALEIGEHTGRTVGSVYSWGAVGSIVGTCLTGYVLIAQLGTVAVLFIVSGILFAAALYFGAQSMLPFIWGGVLGACLVAATGPWAWAQTIGIRLGFRQSENSRVYFSEESNYSFIRVEEERDEPGVRYMTLDFLIHAYVNFNDLNDLRYDYEQIYADLTHANVESLPAGRSPRALFLGGGGYVFPSWLLRQFPDAYAEVAEIDPEVTRAAFETFGLTPHPMMAIYNLDARNHIEDLLTQQAAGEDVGKFDLVYGDAFNHYSPPFHLTTYEFNEKARKLMSDDGMLLANVIDVYNSGLFVGAIVNTLERTFPYVYAFSATPGGPSDSDPRDTFVVLGSLQPLNESSIFYQALHRDMLTPRHLARLKERSHGLVLTDDFAPVDNLLAPVIRLADRN
ncbi:MAG: fused MFS/spermidine synthase [Acidobacteria bacterium]|nr:fused MFS/spermidine synthase [Acidobacteriota bacterium]MDA1234101.1 fused MFS/spermidine synthase [Acidobacteriota bacterium]